VPPADAPIRKQVPIEAYDTQHMQLPGAPTVAFIDCGEFRCRLVSSAANDSKEPCLAIFARGLRTRAEAWV
tara:strand:+ start:1524 stop:1736 length:213 start_codon:yes stop_codon:yes gene_type:complete